MVLKLPELPPVAIVAQLPPPELLEDDELELLLELEELLVEELELVELLDALPRVPPHSPPLQPPMPPSIEFQLQGWNSGLLRTH